MLARKIIKSYPPPIISQNKAISVIESFFDRYFNIHAKALSFKLLQIFLEEEFSVSEEFAATICLFSNKVYHDRPESIKSYIIMYENKILLEYEHLIFQKYLNCRDRCVTFVDIIYQNETKGNTEELELFIAKYISYDYIKMDQETVAALVLENLEEVKLPENTLENNNIETLIDDIIPDFSSMFLKPPKSEILNDFGIK